MPSQGMTPITCIASAKIASLLLAHPRIAPDVLNEVRLLLVPLGSAQRAVCASAPASPSSCGAIPLHHNTAAFPLFCLSAGALSARTIGQP